MRQLTIDPEFRDKIPPLSADEFAKLEENILSDGEVREPLVVWHNTIIDGHHRWAIIQKHPEIPYKIKQMEFPDKWAAIAWMCKNQLGRRNLNPMQQAKLIQGRHDALSKSRGGQPGNVNAKKRIGENRQFVSRDRNVTRSAIAKEQGISEFSVRTSVEFGRGLDEAEKVSPGIREAVLSGAVKAPKALIAEIRNVPEKSRPAVVAAIKQGKVSDAKEIIKASKPAPKKEPEPEPVSEPVPTTPDIKVFGSSPYNTDDFEEELMAVVKTFAFNFKMTLTVHSEMLADDSPVKLVRDVAAELKEKSEIDRLNCKIENLEKKLADERAIRKNANFIERMNINDVPTKELVDELAKRDGVRMTIAEPYQDVQIEVDGPAIVLEIID